MSRVAIVTGASRGIGRAILALAEAFVDRSIKDGVQVNTILRDQS
jgi:NAD(P)-dependent dehydrogenase (short-subunit alcohol dehydrogenase family)